MWPFNRGKSERAKKREACEHENWEKLDDEFTHPNRVYFEDGKPFVHKVRSTQKRCENCGFTAWHNSTEEKVYFEVARVEEV